MPVVKWQVEESPKQLGNQIRSTEIRIVHQGFLIIRNETLGILSNLAIESRNRVNVSGQTAEN